MFKWGQVRVRRVSRVRYRGRVRVMVRVRDRLGLYTGLSGMLNIWPKIQTFKYVE